MRNEEQRDNVPDPLCNSPPETIIIGNKLLLLFPLRSYV